MQTVDKKMFSWRENSASIFNKIMSNSDSFSCESDSEDESTLPLEDIPARTVSSQTNLSDEEINAKLQKWVDLTNINMGPYSERKPNYNSEERKVTVPVSSGNSSSSEESDTEETRSEMELSFKFQFLIISERLKVTLVKAANLFDGEPSASDMITYAKVCLMPCKTQIQTSDFVKGSSNPEFNNIMFFNGFSLQEMHQMSLRITLYGRREKDSQYKNLGEVTVSLEDFDLTAENSLNEYVNTRICPLSRGHGSYRIRLLR